VRCFFFWPKFQRAKYREMSNSHDRISAVVEMQCFVDNEGRFIVKELAIVSGNIQSHWVFNRVERKNTFFEIGNGIVLYVCGLQPL